MENLLLPCKMGEEFHHRSHCGSKWADSFEMETLCTFLIVMSRMAFKIKVLIDLIERGKMCERDKHEDAQIWQHPKTDEKDHRHIIKECIVIL